VSGVPFQTDEEVTAALPRAVAHLRGGGLIAYPTETVYGLGSRARGPEVQAVARLKGRRPDKPFLLLVADRDMAEAQGYVMAQDRLWQLDLMRRASRGQLSEIVGPLALKSDRQYRTFGFSRAADRDFAAAALPPQETPRRTPGQSTGPGCSGSDPE